MSEFTGPPNHESLGQVPLLRDVLVDVHFKPGRALPSEISDIDLGVFSDEARQLANECFLDPDNSNFAKIVYVTGSKKVLVQKAPFKGHRSAVPVIFQATTAPKDLARRQNLDIKYIAMFMNSSTNRDSMFSISGISNLLNADSSTSGISATFNAGKTKNMVTFRGANTPQLSDAESKQKEDLWVSQLYRRIAQFRKPGMSGEELDELQSAAERALFRQICKTYDLQYFEGESDQDIVKRFTL